MCAHMCMYVVIMRWGGGEVGWVLLAQGGGNDIRWLGKGKVRASLSVVIFYIHFNAVTLNHSFII